MVLTAKAEVTDILVYRSEKDKFMNSKSETTIDFGAFVKSQQSESAVEKIGQQGATSGWPI